MSIGSRIGPHVSYSCHGCKYHEQESDGFGDYDHWCENADVDEGSKRGTTKNWLPTTDAKTPDWCPYLMLIQVQS